MKIREIKVGGFKGIDSQDFMLPASESGTYALLAPNGSGKTSFIEALLWALTGQEPEGEVLRHGAKSAAVEIVTEDGTELIKQKTKRGGNKWRVNKNWTSQTEFNKMLEQKTGLPVAQMKPLLVGALMEQAASGNLSEVFMPYLPEQIDRDQVIQYLPKDATNEEKNLVSTLLPDGTFGTDELEKLYKKLFEQRAVTKKKVAESEGFLQAFATENAPSESKEELENQMQELSRKRDAALVAASKASAYRQAVETRRNQEKLIADLDKKIQAARIPAEHSETEIEAVQKRGQAAKNAAKAAYAAMKSLIDSANALKKAIIGIGTDKCPLSERLHCTTDKTAVLDELKAQLNQDCKVYHEQHKAYEDAVKEGNEAEKTLERIRSDLESAKILQQMKEQKATMEKALPSLPEKPSPAEDVKSLNSELDQLRKAIQLKKSVEKTETVRKELEGQKHLRDALERLVADMAPNGPVRQAVTADYLKELEKALSAEAGAVLPGAVVHFEADKGVRLFVDRRGDGAMLPFSALSGGEKASVLFLLIRMLTKAAGTSMLILDELSVLDSETFRRLLTLLREDPMDFALIAAVDHEDTIAEVKKQDIPVISLT